MLDLAQLLSTEKKEVGEGGIESTNVLRRVFMHICLSVIILFALKTILGIFIDGLMLFCHGNIKLTTILLLGLVCVNQTLNGIYAHLIFCHKKIS